MEGKSIYDTDGMINIYREGFKKCLKEISEKEDALMKSVVDDNLCRMQIVISFEPAAVPTYTIIRECMPKYGLPE